MEELERGFTHVQPIIVLQDEARHEATVQAVAQASLGAFKGENETWEMWRSESHTKSVRRAREKDFSKILRVAQESVEQWHLVELPGGVALATEPLTYGGMPSAMRRAQVAGTEFPRERKAQLLKEAPSPGAAPVLYVDASLGMSTGKEAAQVAHGYWASMDGIGEVPGEIIPLEHASFQLMRFHARASVVDNGLTEIPRATATVIII